MQKLAAGGPGGTYAIGPGATGKTKALRVSSTLEALNSEAGALVGKDPGLGHRTNYVLP
jgi:hypothetical protein